MPAVFFAGQVRLLLKRCLTLRDDLRSRTDLPGDLQEHIDQLDQNLNRIASGLEEMINDPDFGAQQLLVNQINDYNVFVELVEAMEYGPLALFDHFNRRDLYFYRFARKFCEQIGYTGRPPLMNAHSHQYFYSLPYLNLIGVPLGEDKHLLALPDFAHELGHIVWVGIYKDFLRKFSQKLRRYIRGQKTKAINQSASATYQQQFDLLQNLWLKHYVIEFFCDMFATWLLGAAFGWSHLRLTLATSSSLYVPGFGYGGGTHPSDEARMRGILKTLELMGDHHNASAISNKWDAFKTILPDQPDNEYSYCYPDHLLEQLAAQVSSVCQQLGLKAHTDQPKDDDNLPSLLQWAWVTYHQDPADFPNREAEKVIDLNKLLSG